MQLLTLAKRGRLVLAAAVCAVYFFGLGVMPLVGPDEPRYAEVAREMFLRGDAVTPTLAGHTWFEKPALLYWMMMAGYAAFGFTEFAARAGSALSGVLTVLMVWWLARRVEAEAGGEARGFAFVCAAVTASTAGLFVFARGASFDAPLTMTVTASIACFFLADGERDERKRRWLLAGFYAGLGATLLAKGLVGPLIVFGVVALYLVLGRRRFSLFRLGILWGPLLAAAVAGVWYAPVVARHGWGFVDEFFVQHHVARFASNKYHHPQPFYFYIPVLAMLALPWTAFLWRGLWAQRGAGWRGDDALSRLRHVALCWLLVPVVFFSLSGSKLPGYILPALPGAAIIAGASVFQYVKGERGTWAMRLTGALALLLFAAGLVYASGVFEARGRAGGQILSPACVVAVVLPAGVAGALAVFAPRRRLLSFAAVTGATFLTVLIIAGCALEPIGRRQSVKHLLERAEAEGFGSLPVFHLHVVERTSEFYAAGRLVYDADGEPFKFEGAWQIFEELRKKGGRGLVLVPKEFVSQVSGADGVEARTLGDNGELTIVYVRVL